MPDVSLLSQCSRQFLSYFAVECCFDFGFFFKCSLILARSSRSPSYYILGTKSQWFIGEAFTTENVNTSKKEEHCPSWKSFRMAPPLFHSIWNNIVFNLPQWDIPFCKNERKGGGAIQKVIPPVTEHYFLRFISTKNTKTSMYSSSSTYNWL